MLQEIERKFLIPRLPSLAALNIIEIQYIEQIYLATGKEHLRARKLIRNNENEYTLTLKRGHGLLRDEVELLISEETFGQLKSLFIPLIKTRYVVFTDNAKVYVDDYYQHKLTVAEVEFSHTLEAEEFIPPSWFGSDITGIKQYENQNLWRIIQY